MRPAIQNVTTFAIYEVERAKKPHPTFKTQEAIKMLLGSDVEACCDYTTDCIKKVQFQPLLAAAHLAFSEHRPLVISPDMIWVTIVQGLAQHIKNHAEKLRSHFVGHQGKLEISVFRDDLVKKSPENPWAEVIGNFSDAIRTHLGGTYDRLISDFTTTGPVERTACEVALLDVFQPYFEYRVYCICGIPEITLEGATEDWQRLREKVDHLETYDLDWWLPAVRNVCDHFVRASQGDVDLRHWRDIYKRETAYGWDTINGWLVQLIPYLKNYMTGNFTRRNPLLTDPHGHEVTTNSIPSGIAQVPFCLRSQNEEVAMEFLGGFIGVTQDEESLALRPKLGWAVRRASEFDQLLVRLDTFKPAPALEGPLFDACLARLELGYICEIPGELIGLYKHCNGVTITGREDRLVCLRPLESVEVIEKLEIEGHPPDTFAGYEGEVIELATGPWLKFADLAEGASLAIELRHTHEKGWKVVRIEGEKASLIAWSLAEFITGCLPQG